MEKLWPTNGKSLEVWKSGVAEINTRLRSVRSTYLPFHYHNGIFQLAEDSLSQEVIHEPFWEILHHPKWKNVDADMKEAIDRRDSGRRDAVLYALKALESTLKIISNDRGWTHGKENGAANFIDNLVSGKNGRFIAVWESESLKALFRDIRNPHGHGPGDLPMPTLTAEQQRWTIECTMAWIKSLVVRL
ncbi:MAG: hypothetical protein KDM64_13800 [Verrucomicrobiae bacterium]|nr:hypothetical protein [Verrucomicrobiae bacterium]